MRPKALRRPVSAQIYIQAIFLPPNWVTGSRSKESGQYVGFHDSHYNETCRWKSWTGGDNRNTHEVCETVTSAEKGRGTVIYLALHALVHSRCIESDRIFFASGMIACTLNALKHHSDSGELFESSRYICLPELHGCDFRQSGWRDTSGNQCSLVVESCKGPSTQWLLSQLCSLCPRMNVNRTLYSKYSHPDPIIPHPTDTYSNLLGPPPLRVCQGANIHLSSLILPH